ncbi:MAG: acyl-CoA thioesterase [Pseudomonadota bacterium]|nr:acyl-CoA thioesterase [Pseudomonadota bacterium]
MKKIKDVLNELNGELCLQTIAMPKDANYQGDIFGGWVVSQMDLAGAVLAHRVAQGRVATVAMNDVLFKLPVAVGDVCRCHVIMLKEGRTSITVEVQVWTSKQHAMQNQALAASALITYVAIDDQGQPLEFAKDVV